MSERENILARIREALTVTAPMPGHHPAHQPMSLPVMADHRRVLPQVGTSDGDRFALFAEKAADLKAGFKVLADPAQLTAELRVLRDTGNWKRLASHRGELTTAAAQSLGLPVLFTDDGYEPQQLEQCDAGISECDALVAQTGTVVLTSRSAGGRALSVLPPHHVVIARREQMVPDLPAAFALIKAKYGANYPSMISFITGPSRTGDIERILVLGAHGPKRLTILCV